MKKIGELLVEQGKISRRDMERAVLAKQEMGDMFGQVVIKLGLLSETDMAAALSQVLDIPQQPSTAYPEEPLLLEGISQDFLVNNNLVPVQISAEKITFAATIPQDKFMLKALDLALEKNIEVKLGLESDINKALLLYTEQDEEQTEEHDEFDLHDDEFIEHLKDLASEAPVIRVVNQLILQAVDLGASDVHIEPFDDGLHIRYRVDGVLQEDTKPPSSSLAPAITSRIKLLAHLNIAERRLPQDGRIMQRVKGHELDLRVSTTPTVHGESIVMRVLDRGNIRLTLSSMGFSEDTLTTFKTLLARPHGVLLVTGPTGSGKTTTLYAALTLINATKFKVITVEDPVEYQLNGVNQIQVQADIEFSFARALRSILRQDPDIIMIGEMRDKETAQIAIQSALTGHLVLSTLHTNTAAGAITRLEDMGIERFLITSAVNGVLSQRLLRTLCEECKEETQLSTADVKHCGIAPFLPKKNHPIYRAKGCSTCSNTGYSGRTSIHELFVLDEAMHKAILEGADAVVLHGEARKQGMITLYEDGLRKVVAGVTSMEEVLRITQDQSENEGSVLEEELSVPMSEVSPALVE